MVKSLRTLLSGAFDYAGLFPPTELPLDQAIEEFARHNASPESWLLGRFICPITQLDELAARRDRLPERVRISTLLRGGQQPAAWREALEQDARTLAEFRAANDSWASVESCEVRIPSQAGPDDVEPLVQHVLDAFNRAGTSAPIDVYELPSGVPADRLAPLINAFGATMRKQVAAGMKLPGVSPCLKLRCGGLTPEAFPNPRHVSAVIVACRDAEVPLKFTAGLHHPLRHFHPPARSWMHGFINVFAAGTLAYTLRLPREDVQGILEESDPNAFQFSDDVLAWSEAEATVGEIRFARAHRVVGIGTCSISEPLEGLSAARWL